jgi:VWFA-related protein
MRDLSQRFPRFRSAGRARPGLAALAVGTALLGTLAGPGPASAADPKFSDTAQVVAVEVPVQVVVDGQPVRGLTADNFEVYDGRKKQPVTGFEVLDLSSPETLKKGAVPAAARRHFLMLFDLSFSEPKSILKARQAATDLVLQDLHPTDLVAVATYRASKGPQLLLSFTSDRKQVEQAIAALGAPELVDRNRDPLQLTAMAPKTGSARTAPIQGGGSEAKEGAQEAVADFLESVAQESQRLERQTQKNQVNALSRSMADLARLMNSVGGRKYVVYLSEGFDSALLRGTESQEEMEQSQAAAASGEIWKVDSEKRFGSTEAVNDVEKMLDEFRRADCVIQSVDIGGLRGQGDQGAQRASGRDSLFQIAKGTGGELYENFNDLGDAMGQMLQRTGVTYVLTFQPDDLKFDGNFRRLRVELKGAPKGARAVFRPGYYAPRPYAQRAASEKLLDAANQLMGDDLGTIPSAVLVTPFTTKASKAYVPVVIEVNGAALLAGSQGNILPAEIYAYAFDSTGVIGDFFTQTVGLEKNKVEAALRQSGLKFFGHLELEPGDYTVRVLVRNGVTGQSSLRIIPVRVPDRQAAAPVLLPPLFPEAPGKWLMVRETPRGDQQQADYPFLLKQQPYIPSSLPVLAPGQDTQIALVGYNLGTGDLQLTAKILGADGREVGKADLKGVQKEAGAVPDRLVATFKPPQQPGEYRLAVTFMTPAGNAEASAPFNVAGSGGAGR